MADPGIPKGLCNSPSDDNSELPPPIKRASGLGKRAWHAGLASRLGKRWVVESGEIGKCRSTVGCPRIFILSTSPSPTHPHPHTLPPPHTHSTHKSAARLPRGWSVLDVGR